jgi:hypothetical protein
MKNLTPITPEALIKLGFKKIRNFHSITVKNSEEVFVNYNNEIVFVNGMQTNATTMEDIKDLIRLFK